MFSVHLNSQEPSIVHGLHCFELEAVRKEKIEFGKDSISHASLGFILVTLMKHSSAEGCD